ncbi:MAG TPA: Rpn family recombination-promoting nuclease/putative transposase, partial [Spirochaetota bacterium]|nr:Rpn family recombination-promoting nuclease/putative transposase [Spirochaetota bacterium]
DDIIIVDLLESESNQEKETDKFNRVDVLAKDSTNTLILIEVQYDRELDYFHRIAYGGAKLITNYFQKSQKYGELKKVITVHIVYFDLGKGNDYLYKGTTQFVGMNNNDILKLNDA